MEKRISGTTSLYGLIGSPVGHSGSPAMYNHSFQRLGIDSAYLAWDIKEDQVADFIKAAKTLGIKGFNVTMPCKTEVAKLVDKLSPAAQIIGAVNTVVIQDRTYSDRDIKPCPEYKDGTRIVQKDDTGAAQKVDTDAVRKDDTGAAQKVDTGAAYKDKILIGHITDGTGFLRNLEDHGVAIQDKKLVLLGGGGAGTAILVQAALDGAREIAVFNRKSSVNFSRLERIAQKLRKKSCDTQGDCIDYSGDYPEDTEKIHSSCKITVHDLEDKTFLYETIRQSDILINCTNVGMKPRDGETLIEDLSVYREDLIVAEIIYNPKETKMMEDARAAGVKTVIGGKGMLLWQGVEAFRLYTGQEMPVEEVKKKFFSD